MSLSRWPGRVKGPEAGRPLSIHLCCRVVQFVGNLSHQAVKNLAAVVPLPTPQRDKCLKTWALVAALKLHHQGNLAVLLDLPMLCTSDLRNFLMELSSDKADRSRLHDASAKTVKLWATKGLVHGLPSVAGDLMPGQALPGTDALQGVEAMSLPGTCLKTVQEVLTRFLVHASTSQSLPQEVDRRQLEAQLQQACCPAGALTLLKILSCREVVQLHEAFGGHVDSGQSPAKLIDALLHTWSQVPEEPAMELQDGSQQAARTAKRKVGMSELQVGGTPSPATVPLLSGLSALESSQAHASDADQATHTASMQPESKSLGIHHQPVQDLQFNGSQPGGMETGKLQPKAILDPVNLTYQSWENAMDPLKTLKKDRGTLLRLVRSKGISAHAPPDSPEGGSVWSTSSHGSQLVPTSFSPGKGRASQADAQTAPMDTVSASPPKQFANSQLSMPFKIAPQPAVLPAAAAKDVLHDNDKEVSNETACKKSRTSQDQDCSTLLCLSKHDREELHLQDCHRQLVVEDGELVGSDEESGELTESDTEEGEIPQGEEEARAQRRQISPQPLLPPPPPLMLPLEDGELPGAPHVVNHASPAVPIDILQSRRHQTSERLKETTTERHHQLRGHMWATWPHASVLDILQVRFLVQPYGRRSCRGAVRQRIQYKTTSELQDQFLANRPWVPPPGELSNEEIQLQDDLWGQWTVLHDLVQVYNAIYLEPGDGPQIWHSGGGWRIVHWNSGGDAGFPYDISVISPENVETFLWVVTDPGLETAAFRRMSPERLLFANHHTSNFQIVSLKRIRGEQPVVDLLTNPCKLIKEKQLACIISLGQDYLAMADLVGKMNEQRTANQHQADIAWVQDTPFADKVDAIEGGHVRLTCVLDSNPGRPPIWMAPQPLPSQVARFGRGSDAHEPNGKGRKTGRMGERLFAYHQAECLGANFAVPGRPLVLASAAGAEVEWPHLHEEQLDPFDIITRDNLGSVCWEVKGTTAFCKKDWDMSLQEILRALNDGASFNLALVMNMDTTRPASAVFRNMAEHLRQGALDCLIDFGLTN